MTGFSVAVYRLLLRLLPRSFRREYGAESVALFRRTVREARQTRGLRRAWTVAVAGWAGVVRGALEEGSELRRQRRGALSGRGHLGATLGATASQACKAVVRAPGLTVGVVALLGLGIGATVTVLSVVDGVLMRALPYPEPERLGVVTQSAHAWPDVLDWRDTVPAFDSLAAASGQVLTLTDEPPQAIAGARVSDGFFEMLGAKVALGRLPTLDEHRQGGRVAVLSHAAWERRWGADPAIVGRTLPVDGHPVEIVGVLSASFVAPHALTGPGVELWVPIDPTDPELDRHDRSFRVVGHLAPGATLEQATEQLRARAEVFARDFPGLYAQDDGSPSRTFPPISLEEATTGDARSPLLILLGGATLLLLVACGNAASLLLARGTARRGELAVRRALGGGRTALLGQLLTESVLLALLAGVVGLGLAAVGVELFRAFEPGELPRVGDVAVDLRVAAAALALSLLTGLVAGLAPAWRASRTAPAAVLRRAETETGSRVARVGSRGLVAAEAALASLLLVGSLTVVRGFSELVTVDPGFTAEGAYAVDINVGRDLPEEQRGAAVERIRDRVSALPGVRAVGAGLSVPFQISGGRRCCWRGELHWNDRELDPLWIHPISAGYFEALGARFRSGRGFAPDDRSDGVSPVILNAAAADELFGSTKALGQTVRFSSEEMRVAGVVEDIRHWGADQPLEPEIYLPYEPMGTWASGLTFAVRAGALPSLEELRTVLAEVVPRAIVSELRPMETVLAESLARQRFYTLVLSVFAGCALVLAGAGLAGTLLYDTRRRRHELGIRVALGAPVAGLVRRVVGRGLGTVGIGGALGLLVFWPLRSHLDTVVPGADPADPWTLLGFGALLLAAALLAAWLPARLVARTDPVRALR